MWNPKRSDDEIRNQLLPRTDKYKELQGNQQVPRTTQSKVIVSCLTKTFGFRTNEYLKYENILSGVIERKPFSSFIRRANMIIQNELIVKAKKENEPYFSIISTLLRICIIIAALSFMLLASVVYWDIEEPATNIIIMITAVLLGISGVIATLCPIFLCRVKYEVYSHEKTIKEQLDALLASQNKANWENQKQYLMWAVQRNFFWLELHIDRIMLSVNGRRESVNEDQK